MTTELLTEMPVHWGMQDVVRRRLADQLKSDGALSGSPLARAAQVALEVFGVRGVRIQLFDRVIEWNRGSASSRVLPFGGYDVFDQVATQRGIVSVPDASTHPLLCQSPEVFAAPGIRFWASAPIHGVGGQRVGAIRLMDLEPRALTEAERLLLSELVSTIERELSEYEAVERGAMVQQSLAPRPMMLDGYEVAGACSPAATIGGDIYDWYPVPGGAAFTLADVMGKGLAAAIVAAGVRAVLRSTAKHTDPTEGLDAASVAFGSEIDGSPNFVTMFHVRLASASGRLSYVDAGHGLASIVDADGAGRRLSSSNLPLGVQDSGTWEKHRDSLEPGDTFFVISDGVLDALGGDIAALEEVETMIWEAPSAAAAVDEVLTLVQERGADDDATVLVVRRSPTSSIATSEEAVTE